MSVASLVQERIGGSKEGSIFTYADFAEIKNTQALALVLSRLSKSGILVRLSKGQYYRPEKTRFGILVPSENKIILKLLEQRGGYLAGAAALNRLGISTQIPSEIMISGSRSNRSLQVGNLRLKFVKGGPEITIPSDSQLTDILEALRFFRQIPADDQKPALQQIRSKLKELKKPQLGRLVEFSVEYRPATRALLGALLQELGLPGWKSLKISLNPLSLFKLNMANNVLPNQSFWRIQ